MTKAEEILAQFPFLKNKNDDDYDYYGAKQIIIDTAPLPDFYTFDEPTPIYSLDIQGLDEGKFQFVILDANKNQVGVFPTIKAAYYHILKDLKGDVLFTGDVKAFTGEEDPVFISSPVDGEEDFSEMFISHTDADTIYLAKASYLSWLEVAVEYEKDPGNFALAYHFAKGHPAFWTRQHKDSNNWITSRELYTEVYQDENGKVTVGFEDGQAVPPERVMHYHDIRLDSWGATFEEAYIDLANKIYTYFEVDGTERPNVPDYKYAEITKIRDERIKKAEQSKKD
jgi:hypothetical protein